MHVTNLARSYSKLLAFEASRILFRLGCDVRVYNPNGLPVKDDVQQNHPKVQELRDLSRWSDGHVWISPEQHGALVSISLMASCGVILISADGTVRLEFSKIKSIGFPYQLNLSVLHKDEPWP